MKLKLLAAIAVAGAAMSTGSAMAAWPPSVVGVWNAFANQTAQQLVITSQGAVGDCRPIVGTLTDTAAGAVHTTIQGFYCPHSGRIQFLRKNPATNDTFQAYSGNVSMLGANLRIGGVFADDVNLPLLGEYNFWAVK